MGVFFSSIFSSLFGRKEVRVLILGLDNAGKTTILCASAGRVAAHRRAAASQRAARLAATTTPPLPALTTTCLPLAPRARRADRLQVDEPVTTVPTIGFNVETLRYKNIKFQVWDLGGQTSIRPYWRCYYPNTDAIIFVVCVMCRARRPPRGFPLLSTPLFTPRALRAAPARLPPPLLTPSRLFTAPRAQGLDGH